MEIPTLKQRMRAKWEVCHSASPMKKAAVLGRERVCDTVGRGPSPRLAIDQDR